MRLESIKSSGTPIKLDEKLQKILIVKDPGVGFESTEVLRDPNVAHGLLIICNRLNLLGCKPKVAFQLGNGTKAIIEVPYEQMDT